MARAEVRIPITGDAKKFKEALNKASKDADGFAGKMRATGKIAAAGLWGMLGAAQGLSYAAATGALPADQAVAELERTIVAMVTGAPGESR